MFPTACATSASLNEPARAGDRHTMPTRSPCIGIPSGAFGLPGLMFATLGVSPEGHLGPNPYHPSLKVTNIPADQISNPLLWNIWCVASYQFVLKPLTNPTTKTLPLCRQHCSILLIIKVFIMLLTGADKPLPCHYFSYYLKLVHDNEMFTIGGTLSCSYGRLSSVQFSRSVMSDSL